MGAEQCDDVAERVHVPIGRSVTNCGHQIIERPGDLSILDDEGTTENPMTRTILITGTSSGYGKAVAEHFLARGWNVVATMRRPDAAAFSTKSERLKLLPLDVT